MSAPTSTPRHAGAQRCWLDEAPTGSDWLHEIKCDGYRMHARIHGGSVKPETTLTNAGRCDVLRLMWQRKCRNYRNYRSGLEVDAERSGRAWDPGPLRIITAALLHRLATV